nr:5'-3' exonuclease H3TH domain-containing protein [Vibrio coralliirubri]
MSSNIHRTFNTAQKQANKNNPAHYIGEIPIYSVKNTILQLFKEQNAAGRKRGVITHLVAVLDFGGTNFRFDLYPEYKANRPPTDPELAIQKIIIERVVQNIGIPLVKLPFYEADDVIASIAVKCAVHGILTTIFSRDKDLFALIDGKAIEVYSGAEKKFFDYLAVVENKGVTPERITDMLTLMGDKVDNIIGVTAFGAKSAAAVLSQYTLDELLENPDLILGVKVRGAKRLRDSFANSFEQISLMRQVATMKTDINLQSSLKNWAYTRGKVNVDMVIAQSVKELLNEGKI